MSMKKRLGKETIKLREHKQRKRQQDKPVNKNEVATTRHPASRTFLNCSHAVHNSKENQ